MASWLDKQREKAKREKLDREYTRAIQTPVERNTAAKRLGDMLSSAGSSIGNALSNYAGQVKYRAMHPLETLASEAKRYQDMPIDELATSFGPSGGSLAGLAGIFAGKGAKTADLAKLALAESMAAKGVPDAQIWKETGWTLNTPDKMPRFEIPDNLARWQRNLPFQARVEPMSNTISHQQLYDAYPDTGNITTVFGQNVNAEGGVGSYHFDPSLNRGVINIESGGANAIQNAKSTGLHEIQHAIQQSERFAEGGNIDDEIELLLNNNKELERLVMQAGMSKDAAIRFLGGPQKFRQLGYENYNKLAGEAESRLVEARMSMTPEERLAQYPYDPEYFQQATGVPLRDLIVRMK